MSLPTNKPKTIIVNLEDCHAVQAERCKAERDERSRYNEGWMKLLRHCAEENEEYANLH